MNRFPLFALKRLQISFVEFVCQIRINPMNNAQYYFDVLRQRNGKERKKVCYSFDSSKRQSDTHINGGHGWISHISPLQLELWIKPK